ILRRSWAAGRSTRRGEAVLAQAIDERPARDPQPARGLGLVAGDRGQRAHDHVALDGLYLFAQGTGAVEGRLGVGFGNRVAHERLEADLASARERYHARDGVLQLAHVPRPALLAQRRDQLGREARIGEAEALR